MRILTYTSLYPSSLSPAHGIFVSQLTKALARRVQMRVVIPENGLLQFVERARAKLPGLCADQSSDAFQIVEHPHGSLPSRPGENSSKPPHAPCRPMRDFPASPHEPFDASWRCRFWTVPKVLKFLDYRLMAFFSGRAFARALASGADLIHAHYAYPDAAAANLLAKRSGLPLVVTCHGSDINVLTKCPLRKKRIRESLRQADAVVGVSGALTDAIRELGVMPGRIHRIPNGVDLERFPLGDKKEARTMLDLPENAPLIVAAGRLEPVKGYDRLLRALVLLGDVRLILVGDGSLARPLKRLALELGVAQRVRFTGEVAHEALAPYFQAADALVISSRSEGWPTIIHEALACGTPVVAPAVGGIPEALADPGLGLVLPSNEPEILAAGIRNILSRTFDPLALRRAAAAHDWNAVASRYMDLFARTLGGEVA